MYCLCSWSYKTVDLWPVGRWGSVYCRFCYISFPPEERQQKEKMYMSVSLSRFPPLCTIPYRNLYLPSWYHIRQDTNIFFVLWIMALEEVTWILRILFFASFFFWITFIVLYNFSFTVIKEQLSILGGGYLSILSVAYIASVGRITHECKGILKETLVVRWRYYPKIWLEGLKAMMKNLVEHNRCPDGDSNRPPAEDISRLF
jgi:hypothetical protein